MHVDKARARILERASELFYAEGFGAVGVDRISDLAPVSKRTLYQRFPTKDDLITEYLDEAGKSTYDSLVSTLDHDAAPAERLLEVFRVLQGQSAAPGYRGCPIVNGVVELPDPRHPGRKVALGYKERMLDFFKDQATQAGLSDPQELAEQLMMLFDGAMSYALVRNTPVPRSIHSAAKALIDAHASSGAVE